MVLPLRKILFCTCRIRNEIDGEMEGPAPVDVFGRLSFAEEEVLRCISTPPDGVEGVEPIRLWLWRVRHAHQGLAQSDGCAMSLLDAAALALRLVRFLPVEALDDALASDEEGDSEDEGTDEDLDECDSVFVCSQR